MRAYLLGLLGGLTALAIVAALAVGALVIHARAERATQRPTLLAQIDEYETWWQSYTVQMTLINRTNPNDIITIRDNYTAQRQPLHEYIAWWQNDYQQRHRGAATVSFRVRTVVPDDLRDPEAITRFLATR